MAQDLTALDDELLHRSRGALRQLMSALVVVDDRLQRGLEALQAPKERERVYVEALRAAKLFVTAVAQRDEVSERVHTIEKTIDAALAQAPREVE